MKIDIGRLNKLVMESQKVPDNEDDLFTTEEEFLNSIQKDIEDYPVNDYSIAMASMSHFIDNQFFIDITEKMLKDNHFSDETKKDADRVMSFIKKFKTEAEPYFEANSRGDPTKEGMGDHLQCLSEVVMDEIRNFNLKHKEELDDIAGNK